MLKQHQHVDLDQEVSRARTKFPEPDGLVAALFEEFGEYCSETNPKKARAELLQVACVAMRLREEIDPLENHPRVQHLKRKGAYLEHAARDVLAELCGAAAAARSEETT